MQVLLCTAYSFEAHDVFSKVLEAAEARLEEGGEALGGALAGALLSDALTCHPHLPPAPPPSPATCHQWFR
jgi:hypothetical protein